MKEFTILAACCVVVLCMFSQSSWAAKRASFSFFGEKKIVMIALDRAEDPKLNLRKLGMDEISSDPVLLAKFHVLERKSLVLATDIPED